MAYRTAAEDAAAIRARLKAEHGWTSQQVSVRARNFSLGSAVDVFIKDPSVPLPPVKAIAEGAESIRRCEITNEILGGGNRYVHVRYERVAEEALTARWLPAVEAAVALIEPGSNILKPVAGTPFYVGREGSHVTVWGEHRCLHPYGNAASAAFVIGERLVAGASEEAV